MKRNKILNTLCVVHNDTHILLGMKKRGFGEGRWNGFGGKLQDKESIEKAAVRELHEEIGITPQSMEKYGVLTFVGEMEENIEVHIFKIQDFNGEPTESEEMKPKWFLHEEIPYEDMWPDDIHWMPLLLEGKKFEGTFTFDNDNIIDYQLEEAKGLI